MPAKNFGDKISTKGFKQNPENINKTGANRKSFSAFNLKCKKEGIEEVTKNVYYSTVGNLMNLLEDEMKAIITDKNEPQWLRWLIVDLGNKQIRAKIMSDYRDWMFGRAEQKTDITTNGKEINISPIEWIPKKK